MLDEGTTRSPADQAADVQAALARLGSPTIVDYGKRRSDVATVRARLEAAEDERLTLRAAFYRAQERAQAAEAALTEHQTALLNAGGRISDLESALADTGRALDTSLVAFYKADAVKCARLCDDVLDKRGALLGRVRALAAGLSAGGTDTLDNTA